MQKIVTNLWFDTNALEAVEFYVSVFSDARITDISYYTEVGPMPAGTVLTVDFKLEGQRFTAINGGPAFKFNPAVSLLVNCTTQAEVDRLWNKLLEGGGEDMCGWLHDKYGLSWQIVPVAMQQMITDGDKEKVNRVMAAMMKMKKLDIAKLKAAFEGQEV